MNTSTELELEPAAVLRLMQKRSFATLASTSAAGSPHVAGVIYSMVGTDLWISTMATSRKARNVEASGRVAVTIPVRRLPIGPPSVIQFQGTARIVDRMSDEVLQLAQAGALDEITGHGELELEGGSFVCITPGRWILTHGLGLSLRKLIADPLNASGRVASAELAVA